MDAQEFVIGLRRRLLQFGGDDVEHRLEMSLCRAAPAPRRHGRSSRWSDQLAPGKFCDRRPHRWVRLQRRVIDLVHVGQIIIGVQPCSVIMPRMLVP